MANRRSSNLRAHRACAFESRREHCLSLPGSSHCEAGDVARRVCRWVTRLARALTECAPQAQEDRMSHRVLLLNAYYVPVRILRWEDAVKMKYEGTADVVAEYEE